MQIEPAYGWDDLIPSAGQKADVKKCLRSDRIQPSGIRKVGICLKMVYGKGVSMLFYGAAGDRKDNGSAGSGAGTPSGAL